jgi:hypothetical protein
VSAATRDGQPLVVEKTNGNHWRVDTRGELIVKLSYRVFCNQRSVTTNYVDADYGVFNGAPTFITIAENAQRPHDVSIELPVGWTAVSARWRRAHRNSNLSTVLAKPRPRADGAPAPPDPRWPSLGLEAHEFFHLYNVKRLRPIELGPFQLREGAGHCSRTSRLRRSTDCPARCQDPPHDQRPREPRRCDAAGVSALQRRDDSRRTSSAGRPRRLPASICATGSRARSRRPTSSITPTCWSGTACAS